MSWENRLWLISVQLKMHPYNSALLFRPVQRLRKMGHVWAQLLCIAVKEKMRQCLTYMVFSDLYSNKSSLHLYIKNLDSRDALGCGMCCDEEGSVLWVLRPFPDSVTKTLHAKRVIPSSSVLIKLDEDGTLVNSGFLPLQSGVKTRKIIPGLEEYQLWYGREFQETKAVTKGSRRRLQRPLLQQSSVRYLLHLVCQEKMYILPSTEPKVVDMSDTTLLSDMWSAMRSKYCTCHDLKCNRGLMKHIQRRV